MTFEEAQHARDTEGRFTHKQGAIPEVSLAAQPDPYADFTALLDEVEARVGKAQPGTASENPAYWLDKDELVETLNKWKDTPAVASAHKNIQEQPVQYLEWFFNHRAEVSKAAMDQDESVFLAYRELSEVAGSQSRAIAGNRIRVRGIPDMPEVREYDPVSVSAVSSALNKILSLPASEVGGMDLVYERPIDKNGHEAVRVRHFVSSKGHGYVTINYANGQSDTLGRESAAALARRLALQEDYTARQEGISPRTWLH